MSDTHWTITHVWHYSPGRSCSDKCPKNKFLLWYIFIVQTVAATMRIDRDSKSFDICMSSFTSVFIFFSWFPFSSFQLCLCFGLRLQSVTELYLWVTSPFLPLRLMWSTSLLYLQLASAFRHVSLFCFNLGVSSNEVSSSVCIFNLHSLLQVPLWLVTWWFQ